VISTTLADYKHWLGFVGAGFTVWQDLQERKVKNHTIVVLFIVGFVTAFFAEGASGLLNASMSLAVAFLAGLPLYLPRVLGGGDFKLLMALSPFLIWNQVLILVLSSLIWGSILGLFMVILKGKLKSFLANLKMIFLKAKPSEESLHKIPYSVALVFGYLTAIGLKGWWP
jgi:Flp pilus assembly protein protease CpaA